MCRNIKTLHNFNPPQHKTRSARRSLQFVRKLSGFARPSKANEAAFNRAVDQVTDVVHDLLATLVTNAPPRPRDEAAKAKAGPRSQLRRVPALDLGYAVLRDDVVVAIQIPANHGDQTDDQMPRDRLADQRYGKQIPPRSG